MNDMTPDHLLARAAAALEDDDITAADLSRLERLLEKAAEIQVKRVEEAQARSTAPELTSEEARAARQESEDAEHEKRRLDAALTKVSNLEITVRKSEEEKARVNRYEAVVAKRGQVAARIIEEAPGHLVGLARLCWDTMSTDDEIAAVNRDLPRGLPPLSGTEGFARGIQDNPNEMKPFDNNQVRLVQCILPDLRSPDGILWPPNRDYARDYRGRPRLDHIRALRMMVFG